MQYLGKISRVGWIAIFGTACLMLCLLMTAYETSSSGADAVCRDQLKTASSAPTPLDDGGTLRIAEVWPQTVKLSTRLCLVVAGVAPKISETRLKQNLDDRSAEAAAAQKLYERAIEEASTANKLAVDAEAKADAAERDKAPDAAGLRTSAQKARADATVKDAVQTAAQKKSAAANAVQDEAAAALNRGLPPVDITLFLNDRRSPLVYKAKAVSSPQVLTYDLVPAADAVSDAAKFWRDLLAGKTDRSGIMKLVVGVSKSQSSGPEAVAPTQDFLVYKPVIFWIGVASMIALFVAFGMFAAESTVLRDSARTDLTAAVAAARDARAKAAAANPPDNDLNAAANQAEAVLTNLQANPNPGANRPNGTYSLGRTQMAIWLGLSIAGFIFLWLTLGFYLHVITTAILVLLGINGATGLAAIVIDNPPGSGSASSVTSDKSRGFFQDIMSDKDGPKLQRIQVLVWTLILAIIFIWNVFWNFVFVDFDTNLLLLMGIANAMYLGFKTQEKS